MYTVIPFEPSNYSSADTFVVLASNLAHRVCFYAVRVVALPWESKYVNKDVKILWKIENN